MADQILQEIKDRLDIAEVIGSYIQIKKSGTNFKAICPFHGEKTASLMVSPQKQIWHCFGCGEGGDVFGFVTRYENLEFREALKILAERAGVKLPEYKPADPKQQQEKELLLRINDFAARFYHEVLTSSDLGKPAMEYLKNRGLTDGTIRQWKIGFAPDDFHALEKALVKKGVQIADMVKAGVSVKNENGQVYDRFRGRVTFPIFNYMGEVVGFTARVLKNDEKSAKYINSPETPIYSKSQVLFGLNFAKDEARKKDELVIVEGQMDCISLHQGGFKNVIASSGTAYNQGAVSFTTARRLTRNIKLCFDSDKAGQLALKKTGEMLLKSGFTVKVITLKGAKDPDELIRKGIGLWDKAVTGAVWFLDYQISLAEQNFAEDPIEQKRYLSEEVVPLLGFITDPLEQDHYIHKMVERFKITERVIREQIKKIATGGGGKSVPEPLLPARNGTRSFALEKEILGGMMKFPEFYRKVLAQSSLDDFKTPEMREILSPVFEKALETLPNLNSVVAKEALFMVESQLEEVHGDDPLVIKNLEKSFSQFKLQSLRSQLEDLNIKIQLSEQKIDREEVKKLQQQFSKLSALRLKYESQI